MILKMTYLIWDVLAAIALALFHSANYFLLPYFSLNCVVLVAINFYVNRKVNNAILKYTLEHPEFREKQLSTNSNLRYIKSEIPVII